MSRPMQLAASVLVWSGLALATGTGPAFSQFPDPARVFIFKDNGREVIPLGLPLTYTISVGNSGPANDPAVTVVDNLPAGLNCSYTSVASGGATGNSAGGSGDLNELLNLPDGSQVTYTLNCTVDPSLDGSVLSNTATATGSVYDNYSGDNQTTDSDPVSDEEADISVTKDNGVDVVPIGGLTIYEIVVRNNGPADDPYVSVVDNLPPNLDCTYTFFTLPGNPPTGGSNGDGSINQVISMPAGSEAYYLLNCIPGASSSGSVSNTVEVSGSVIDPDLSNNTASDTDVLAPNEADLSVTLADSPDPVLPGETLTYTATVTNNGPFDVLFAYPTIAIPPELTLVSTVGCIEDPTGFPICRIAGLNASESKQITYTTTVGAGATGPINASVDVSGTRTDPNLADNVASTVTQVDLGEGTFTIAKNTVPVAAGDASFTYSSPDGELNGLVLTTFDNAAVSPVFAKVPGTYSVTENEAAGWELQSLTCSGDTDSGSTVDLVARTVEIDLDDEEDIICVFVNARDAVAVQARTRAIINNFLIGRADQITANGPDLSQRLLNRSRSRADPPVGLGASGTPNGQTFALDFESGGPEAGPPDQFAPDLGVWAKARWSHWEADGTMSDLAMLYAGVDILATPDLVLGILGEVDWTATTNSADGFAIGGTGWLAGPYVVARLHQNALFEGLAAWGRSENWVDPLGLFTDQFTGTRWLARAKLVGDFPIGEWRFNPHLAVIYFEESQDGYTDSLSNWIDTQTVALGRLTFGPSLTRAFPVGDGTSASARLALKGIWDFASPQRLDLSGQPAAPSAGDIRARIEAGLSLETMDGLSLSLDGFADGIETGMPHAFGGSIGISGALQ